MKSLYWVSTSLVSLVVLASALTYLLHKGTIDGVKELGFPSFFRIELALLKIAGALVLIAPFAPPRVKEWAYAGIGLFFLTAIVAHTANGDSIALSLINIVVLVLLAVSNVTFHRLMVGGS